MQNRQSLDSFANGNTHINEMCVLWLQKGKIQTSIDAASGTNQEDLMVLERDHI